VKKVLVFGQFRAVHVGHLRLFEYARSLGDTLIVAINTRGKEQKDIDFSETIIRSFPFALTVIKYDHIEELLSETKPDIVVRGQEFRNIEDEENEVVIRFGIRLMFGSGNTYLSEEDFNYKRTTDISIKEEFRHYASQKGLSADLLRSVIKGFTKKRVVVAGDLIVDEIIMCQALGMSREDPVVVSTPISTHKFVGGAGIVAAHCKALGAEVSLVSLVGGDDSARWAENYLSEMKIDTHFIKDLNRPTVVKQRFRNSSQTLFRLTHFRSEEADDSLVREITRILKSLINNCDLLIFSDFSYGTLNDKVMANIQLKRLREKGLLVAADSQSSSQVGSLSKFKDIDLVSPTEYEARIELRNELDGIAVLAYELGKSLKSKSVILKLGADGVLVGGKESGVPYAEKVPAANQHPVDVSGAGDSLLAVSALALTCGRKLFEAAFLGSLAAGIQVSRKGNIPIEISEMEDFIGRVFLS